MEIDDAHTIDLSTEQRQLLLHYAQMIFSYNLKKNITGFKTVEAIVNNLIISSINPLKNCNVPRGTHFLDLGTGAGVPGIPLIIYWNKSVMGTLLDANASKIDFVKHVVERLGLYNCAIPVVGRAEELAHEHRYREKFDFVVTRACAHPLMALEYGLPFVKCGGWMYIYYNHLITESGGADESNSKVKVQNEDQVNSFQRYQSHELLLTKIQERVVQLGGRVATREDRSALRVNDGILIIKEVPTDVRYPRRHAVVQREIKKLR